MKKNKKKGGAVSEEPADKMEKENLDAAQAEADSQSGIESTEIYPDDNGDATGEDGKNE